MPQPVRIEILLQDQMSPRVREMERRIDELRGKTRGAAKEMQEMDKTVAGLHKNIVKLAGAFTIKELVSKVAMVRGEFQQIDVALKTILGDGAKAAALMDQLVRTAAITPFGLTDVANGAKQLLAYGLEAEKVNETLIRLGDIAAGLSMPLNDLVYLYGTTMTQGKLMTQDLNQFTGRGIPMVRELAKQFGVAESKVKELVEAGKVGFPEVQKVIESLTNEGGQFGGLMEAQSHTIIRQISNIEDAIDMMFNEIGQQSEGIINTTLSGVSYVIEHYERFGRILLGLVATYGTYSTAIMLVTTAKGWATAAEALHYNWLLLVEKAQRMLNATMLANPYVLVATLIAGVVAAMVSMKTEAERIKEAEEDYEVQLQKTIEAEEKHRRKMEELCDIAGDETISTDTRREALAQLEMKYPDIFAKYDTEYEKLKNIKQIKQEIAALDGQKSIIQPKNELDSVDRRIHELTALSQQIVTRRKSEADSHQPGRYNYVDVKEKRGLTPDEAAEYKMLQQRRERLTKQVRTNEVNAWFQNLTGIDNDTLEAEIKRRRDLIAKMGVEGASHGKITQAGALLNGTYSRDELQFQLNKLTAEQNRRNKPTDSSADWQKAAKKKYEDALKAYNDFVNNKNNSLNQEDFEKKAKEFKDTADAAKKEYDKVKPGTNKDAEAAKKAAERAKTEREKQEREKERLGQSLADLQRESDQMEIEAMQEGLEKKLREIDNAYQERKNKLDKQEVDFRRSNVKAGIATGTDGLTDEQRENLNEARANSDALYAKERADAEREAAKAMEDSLLEYLKAYGTYQEQKLAITKEYARKIAEAEKTGNTNEVRRLERERDESVGNAYARNLSMSIDWGTTFEGVGTVLKDIAVETLEKVEVYMKTNDYRKLSTENKKVYAELRDKLRQETGAGVTSPFNFKIWDTIAKQTRAYQESVRDLQEATDAHTAACDKLETAERALGEATDETSKAIAKAAVDSAQAKVEQTGQAQRDAEDKKNNAQEDLTDSTNAASRGLQNFAGYLDEMSSGSLFGFANGLTKLITSLGKGSDGVGKALGELGGKIGGIIGAILQILDALGDNPKEFIGDLLDKVLVVVEQLIVQIFNGDLIGTVLKSVGNGLLNIISGFWKTVTFGALDIGSWFGSHGNSKQVEDAINGLTERNELLQGAIEDLTDEIAASKGTKSVAAYRQAYDNQQQTNANYQEIAQQRARYWKKHHSWGYYWDKSGGFDSVQMEWIRQNVRGDFNGDMWSLSAEEMKKLLTNVDIAERIRSNGKGGYGNDVLEALQDYAAQAGKLEELTNQLYEGLTGISFDGMYDSFVDSLMDMKYDAESAAKDISEYFMRAMLSNKIGEVYSERLKEWWDKFGKAMEDNELTETERKALADEYMRYVNEAIALRDRLAEATGYDPDDSGTSQSGKSGGFVAMSQDQGTKLEGIGTSIQMHSASIDMQMGDVAEQMSRASDLLARIEQNTGSSAQQLKEMNDKIDKLIRDGLKMR